MKDNLYEELATLNLILVVRDLFCLISVDECKEYAGNLQIKSIYLILFNPKLKCVYSEEQTLEMLKYSNIFDNMEKELDFENILDAL